MNESTGRPGVKHHTSAERKAEAVMAIEQLIKCGKRVRAAVADVAYRTGLGERTLFTCLSKTKGISRDEYGAELAPKRRPSKPRRICHPDALNRFIDLCAGSAPVTVCFRQLRAEAAVEGWAPIPSERTLRRELERHMSSSDRWFARRQASPPTA